MKVGIIREGKTPPDKRVPFTPEQCKEIQATFPQLDLVVQQSPIRAFNDEAYRKEGIAVVESIDDATVIFGVKEVNLGDLLPNKTYFFFSHTIKEQPYNRELLRTVIERNIKLIDYETLTAKNGGRLVGFGRYAGIVGCYNAFRAYGKRSSDFELKPAHLCSDKTEMLKELPKVKLPSTYKIALTGLGRVAGGAIEILDELGVRGVTPSEFLTKEFSEAVYTQLSVENYFRKSDGKQFKRNEVYQNPEQFESDFYKFSKTADMYISCHFWDSRGPKIFSKEEMQSNDFKVRVIADISCDIDDPIPSTIRPSTIADPIYEYNRKLLKEVETSSDDTITVMAVDNLPCELPKDASDDFGNELIRNILPNLFGSDNDGVIERATIAENGKLKPTFTYLADYLKG